MNIRWKHESLVLVKDGSFLFSFQIQWKIKVCNIRETPVTAQGHTGNALRPPDSGLAVKTLRQRRSRI
jgi:hypothetical protein